LFSPNINKKTSYNNLVFLYKREINNLHPVIPNKIKASREAVAIFSISSTGNKFTALLLVSLNLSHSYKANLYFKVILTSAIFYNFAKCLFASTSKKHMQWAAQFKINDCFKQQLN